MENDKSSDNLYNSGISNDERRGLNESSKFENAKNNYQNDQPTQDVSKSSSDTNTNEDQEEEKQ